MSSLTKSSANLLPGPDKDFLGQNPQLQILGSPAPSLQQLNLVAVLNQNQQQQQLTQTSGPNQQPVLRLLQQLTNNQQGRIRLPNRPQPNRTQLKQSEDTTDPTAGSLGIASSRWADLAAADQPQGSGWQDVSRKQEKKPKFLLDPRPLLGIMEDGMPYFADFTDADNAYAAYVGKDGEIVKRTQKYFGVRFSLHKVGKKQFLVWVEHLDCHTSEEVKQLMERAFTSLYLWCSYVKASDLDYLIEWFEQMEAEGTLPIIPQGLPHRLPPQ